MNVYLDSVGCRLNQSEIEAFARQFRQAGHVLVSSAAEADLVVINTCAVTSQAASDSRGKIRQAARLGAGAIIPTGCWVSLSPQAAVQMQGVIQVVPNAQKDSLVADLLHIPQEAFEHEPVEREPLPGARSRTRAFIKVQDGCDNRCTFCVTTLARGEGRSIPVKQVIADIRSALEGGAKEVVLTGVHLGSWGGDLPQAPRLHDLVRIILDRTNPARLRLSSLEPWDLDEDFFRLWDDPRLCRHFHLPLQSGCAATLRRMARKTTPSSFRALVEAARRYVPEAALTTDIITGFPGETDQEFEESLQFIESIQFAGGHVFTYSAREGTAAARMPGQVPHPIRKERSARLREALSASARQYRSRFLGRELPVLWESITGCGPDGWLVTGLTDNYLRVSARSDSNLWNVITPAHLEALDNEGLTGRLVEAGWGP
jgi:threonylcarbamoyladenosine tRNA methylthiotransferase MtaB